MNREILSVPKFPNKIQAQNIAVEAFIPNTSSVSLMAFDILKC